MLHMFSARRARRARNQRCIIRSWFAVGLLLLTALLVPNDAWAKCPASFTVASGASYSFDATCDTYQVGTGTSNPNTFMVVYPQHGAVTAGSLPGKTPGTQLTYTNNGDGAISDSFVWKDATQVQHSVTITIGAGSSITVSPASLNFTAGTAVNTTFSASGGMAPYGYTLTGTLPTGVSFNAGSGTLSGTPTKYTETYNFTVTATDSASVTGQQAYSGLTQPGNIIVSPSTLPHATASIPYTVNLTSSGGLAPYTYTLLGTSPLPPGLNLATNGTLSGTVATAGSYSFTVISTDSAGDGTGASTSNRTTKNYTLVADATPTITVAPSSLPNATVGTAYSQAFTASGGTAPYTYSVTAGALPAGLTLSGGGTVSGTPTEAGAFNFTIQAKDANNFTGTQAVSMTVNAPTITVSPGVISNPQVGVPYSQQFTASGGTQGSGYTFASSGAVPAGLSLSSSGLLSGTPTSATSSATFTVTATDHSTGTGAPFPGSQMYTVSVADPTLSLSPAPGSTLPAGTQNASYSQQFTASGGTPAYTYQKTGGTLPAGLSLNASGLLSGTPTQAGAYTFTVEAADNSTGTGSPFTISGSYTLNIAAVVPVAHPVSATEAYDSTSNVIATNFSGGTPTSVAIASPASHGIATVSGTTLTYTPNAGYAGTDSFTYTGTNSAGTSPTPATVNITVSNPTLSVSAGNALTAQVGQPYTQTFTFSGGAAPYTGASVTGLPNGLSVTGTTGNSITVAGTPTASGTFSLGVSGTDSSTGNGPFPVNQSFTLTVNAASINLAPASLPSANVGSAYSQTITASGGIAPYSYAVTSGALPTNMTLSPTGVLSGTPTAGGSFNFTVTATDSSTGAGSPATASASYTLTVNASTITLSPTTLPGAQRGNAYNQNLSASGGTAPYTYAVTSGALPAGTSLSPSGTLSGTPTASGTFNFTVAATDSSTGTGPYTGSRAYALTVASPTITVTPATLPNPAVGSAYSQTLSASGGTGPYTYAVTSGALPNGLTLSGGGALSGTPTAGGSFTFTVTATDSSGAGGPYTGAQTYTVTVATPAIIVTPATLPAGQQGTAYSQSLAANGGTAPYTYAVTSGALPNGLTLSSGGALSGTPTASGSFHFTITATDSSAGSGPYAGNQAYTLSVTANPPVVNDDTASTPSQQAVAIPVTNNDTGNITSIALAQATTHGTATVNGLSVNYTPTGTFFGTDTFTYTATGPGGTSTPATVTVTVTPLSAPTAKAKSATVLGGKSVTIHATTGATGGPYTKVAIVKTPDIGSASVSGTDIVYKAPGDASGTHTFTYTLSNAYGTSTPATVSVHINPLPRPVPLQANAISGHMLKVNLTAKAHGGPFTDAQMVAIAPSTAGTAKIIKSGDDYMLQFTPATDYSGTAKVTYTLSNAYATSAPGTVTITVISRPDPTKDAEVLGILNAQAQATRRFARGQTDNFEARLESLHNGGSMQGFQNNVSFIFGGGRSHRTHGPSAPFDWDTNLDDPDRQPGNRALDTRGSDAQAQHGPRNGNPESFAFWAAGAVNFGTQKLGASHNGIDFTTSGLTLGADKRVSDRFAFGGGIGYGHDASDVGHNGSRSTADAYNVAAYASYRPGESGFIDGLVGYQWLSFDARRYVTADGSRVQGTRDGSQVFGSLSGGFEHHDGILMWSPYGRVDLAKATLDPYTEQGSSIYALHYNRQTVRTTTGSLGLRLNWSLKRDFGLLQPMLRVEYRHDFQGSSDATLRYADLPTGPLYRATVGEQSRNHTLLGIGLQTQSLKGMQFRVEYQNLIDNSTSNNQSILLNLQWPFNP